MVKTIIASDECSQTVMRQSAASTSASSTRLSNNWKQELAPWTRLIREQKTVAD
jgi:hypothetical protein